MDLDLISTGAAADILGVSRRTIHRMVDVEELIPALRAQDARNGSYLFRRIDVERLAKDRAPRLTA